MAKDVRVLIIHGWSDCSESFVGMKQYLVARQIGQVETVYYVDYESREDNMTYEDVIEGFNNQLIGRKLIASDGSSPFELKIIVHSTGGLVVRHWLWRYYLSIGRLDVCPVSTLVMLAPANFGSPLAQMGKSFLGGLVKGRWKVGDLLETGKKILNGLELGSAYQWQLAHRDLLSGAGYFMPDRIKTTILVGNRDYTGIRGWLNKPGTDGTVVISGTNLNTAKLCLKFTAPAALTDIYVPHQWQTTRPVSDIAFGILDGYDHGSIVDQSNVTSADPAAISNVLVAALQVDEAGFKDFQAKLDGFTNAAYQSVNVDKYQQFLVHALDYQEQSAMDFTLDFAVFKKSRFTGHIIEDPVQTASDSQADSQTDAEYDYSDQVNQLISSEAHTYSQDSSYRRLLVNTNALALLIGQMDADPALAGGYGIFMKVFVPAIDKNIGYYTKNLQNILIYDSTGSNPDVPTFFYANTTTLIEIQVDRINTNVWVDTVPRQH